MFVCLLVFQSKLGLLQLGWGSRGQGNFTGISHPKAAENDKVKGSAESKTLNTNLGHQSQEGTPKNYAKTAQVPEMSVEPRIGPRR